MNAKNERSSEAARFRFAGTTAGHRRNTPSTAHSFSETELARFCEDRGVGLIMHHGEAPHIEGFRRTLSFIEVAVVFCNRRDIRPEVALDEIIGLLTTAGDSARSRNIRLLRHGGDLNRKALQFALTRAGGGRLVRDEKHSFASYRELADACERIPGALAIGLRGVHAGNQGLVAIPVGGVNPLDPAETGNYPLQYPVHAYLREGAPELVAKSALAYVDAVARRVALDNRTIFGAASRRRAESERLLLAA